MAKVGEIFGTCDVPTSYIDIYNIGAVIDNALSMMSMVDYPYASSFITPMPAWPVTAATVAAQSEYTAHESDEMAVIYAMAGAGGIYYNYTGQIDCLDPTAGQDGDIDANGWNVLYCNEIVQPFASNATSSMYPAAEWNETAETEWCYDTYGERPQFNWVFDSYGGSNPPVDFMSHSNIIFSNGELDPWRSGGVVMDINDQILTLVIENGAHHLDLRSPNDEDPQSVTDARQ
jgi:Serine carboxypeptidase S28.